MQNKTLNPIAIFASWFAEAAAKEKQDHTAMTLATATKEGKPSARVVLLKAFNDFGFVFYTNLESRKAEELLTNPQAALCFFWPISDKQVRIEGSVELINAEEADHYFATRPRVSQLGAWASQQSRDLPAPQELQRRITELDSEFKDKSVPRPHFWSGFRLLPERIEFWQRGEYRLHQRTVYYKKDDAWQKKFLYP